MRLSQNELQTIGRLTESDSPTGRDVIYAVETVERLQDEIVEAGADEGCPQPDTEAGLDHPERWLRRLSTVLEERSAPGDATLEVST